MTTTATVPFIDVLEPGFDYGDAKVAAARKQSWYANTPLGPLVLRHREGSEIVRDRRFVMGGERYMAMHGVTEGPLYDWWMNTLPSVSRDDHARLRGLVNSAYTPRRLRELRPFVRETVERLADAITPGETCEFIAGFAEPLPALVMCEMLGVPSLDYDRFHHYASDIALAFSRHIGDDLPRVQAAVGALSDYLGQLIADRREQLGDDLLSSLIIAQTASAELTPEELHNLVVMLVFGGQDTSARQIGLAALAFAEHPEQWRLLGERPELAAQAVDEVCRWAPMTQTNWRFAGEDLEYRGLELEAGTMVLICTVAANRDPRAYDDPEVFDIRAARDARPLTFGGGVHHCLGAATARMVIAEALGCLAARFDPPELVGTVAWRPPAPMIHGPDVLPLRFGG